MQKMLSVDQQATKNIKDPNPLAYIIVHNCLFGNLAQLHMFWMQKTLGSILCISR